MRFLVNTWRSIGARLYLALGFAVLLTLASSAVGVYYFEQSGDLNFRVRSESVPVLEASWAAVNEAERLRSIGLGMLVESESGSEDLQRDSVNENLKRLEDSLATVSSVPTLEPGANAVYDAAYDLAQVIDEIEVQRTALAETDATAAQLWSRLNILLDDSGLSDRSLSVLLRASLAEDDAALEGLWGEFATISSGGVDPAVGALGGGQGVFWARGQQLALQARIRELSAALDDSSDVLEESASALLSASRLESSSALDSAVQSFDEGRALLALVSVASVVAAVLAAWLWVGNAVVRRLSRMSDRMRAMATGDLETPVPEVGRDEIGQLADALEVFRQQALEVQRLNLVERLYGELREANEELQRMQDRLVAQGKLAALGELVSGVAHEISNPLNFVKNFSEGSLELYNEMTETLTTYRSGMSKDDAASLDMIGKELTESLDRVNTNGARALAIVERMQGLGVVGGDPTPTDLNEVLQAAVQTGCNTFQAEWDDFSVKPTFDLDSSLGQVPLVESDFAQAVINLVSNACYSMRLKQTEKGDSYEPVLTASTRLEGEVVEVRIHDNGTGISDDVVGRMFNPFFSTRQGALGAGLGLPIAADVARRTGGDLSADTVHGEYAEFKMSLPATAGATASA